MSNSSLTQEAVNQNMRFYEYSRAVPKAAQKNFSNGKFSGTDINPMWRIKKLTEMYGPAGIGWYTEVLQKHTEQVNEDTIMAIVDLNLYVKDGDEWSKPIFGTGGNMLMKKTSRGIDVSDEGYKMAYTDALSVACKSLGIGADIYWDKDKTKYGNFGNDDQQTDSSPVSGNKMTGDVKTKQEDAMKFIEDENAPISQEELTKLGKFVTTGKTMDEKNAIASELKKIIGNANYKVVDDADKRRAIYTIFMGYIKKEDK